MGPPGGRRRREVIVMMRAAVSLVTALILFLFGVLLMLLMFFGGAYGNDTSKALPGLLIISVLLLVIIVVASVGSGWLAHVLQTRSGISPWLVGPGTVVAVTAVAMIVIFVGGSIVTSVLDAALRPAPPRPAPASNRRY
jgi:hypothetical protein